MKKYECLYIVNINYDSEGTSAVSARVETLLKNVGAEVKNSQPWGKRKLAYAIDKERYGDYVLVHFEGEDPDLAEFHRELEIEGAVLHYMTIRIDEFPDFDSLTIPQAIDADRKRPAAPGGRRPRHEDADEADTSDDDTDEVEDDDAPEAPEAEEAASKEEVATEEAEEETPAAEEEAPAEEAEETEASEETAEEDKPADDK